MFLFLIWELFYALVLNTDKCLLCTCIIIIGFFSSFYKYGELHWFFSYVTLTISRVTIWPWSIILLKNKYIAGFYLLILWGIFLFMFVRNIGMLFLFKNVFDFGVRKKVYKMNWEVFFPSLFLKEILEGWYYFFQKCLVETTHEVLLAWCFLCGKGFNYEFNFFICCMTSQGFYFLSVLAICVFQGICHLIKVCFGNLLCLSRDLTFYQSYLNYSHKVVHSVFLLS